MAPIHLGEAPALRARGERPWEPEARALREHREAFGAMLRESIAAGAKRETLRRAESEKKAARARAAAEASRIAQARTAALRRSAEENAREQLFAEFRRELEIIDLSKAVGLSGEQALALARRHATDEEILDSTMEARVLGAVERMVGART